MAPPDTAGADAPRAAGWRRRSARRLWSRPYTARLGAVPPL